MESLNCGIVELGLWDYGRIVELWDCGIVEFWDCGIVESWNRGIDELMNC